MAKKKSAKSVSASTACATFSGKTFVLAGKFEIHGFDKPARELIAARGGKTVGKVNAKLDYLVLGRTGLFFHASGPERYMFCSYGAAGDHFSAIQGTPAEGVATKGGGDIEGPIEKDR